MKALVYRKKNTLAEFGLQLEEVPDPVLADKDVIVRVKATGINPGDAQYRRTVDAKEGEYIILGYEFSGVIEQVGPSVNGFNIGDKVFGAGDPSRHGSYAELLAIDYRLIAKIPVNAPFDHVAAVPLTTLTAWESIFRQDDQLPADVKNVMVIGAAGGVGSMALQLLKARTEAKVIATASRNETEEWCRKMGADIVINHKKDIKSQLKKYNIRDVDMIFSVNGLKDNIALIPEIIKPYGYLSVVDLKDAVDFSGLMNKSVTIYLETIFTKVMYDYRTMTQGVILAKLANLVDIGKVKTTGHTFLKGLTRENILKAHTMLEKGDNIGKIVIDLE